MVDNRVRALAVLMADGTMQVFVPAQREDSQALVSRFARSERMRVLESAGVIEVLGREAA